MDPFLAAALGAAAVALGGKAVKRGFRSLFPAKPAEPSLPSRIELHRSLEKQIAELREEQSRSFQEIRAEWQDALKLEIEDQMIWRQGVADRLAEEGSELELTLTSGYEEVRAWRRDEVDPKLAAFAEVAQLSAAMQQQVAALSESVQALQPWSAEVANRVDAAGSAVVEIARRLRTLEDSVETIEAIVEQAPPRQPAIPMGPPPAGGGVTDELAELMRRQQDLQRQFAQRGKPGIPAPTLRPPL
jgi:hypothetical protein